MTTIRNNFMNNISDSRIANQISNVVNPVRLKIFGKICRSRQDAGF